MILNAVVDSLGELLDRGALFVEGHWPALLVIAAAVAVGKRFRFPPALAERWRSIASRRLAPYAIAALLSLTLSAGAAVFHGLPLPSAHDDYAYLLTGEFLAHGHTSAPTHPMWQHLEAIHILEVPRYSGKYQPGPGAVLAVGSFLFHTPIAGVWLCIAAACVAILWMLRAFVAAEWALLGAALFAIHPTVFEWSHSYHSGALAVAGGAFVIGGARRLVIAPTRAAGAALGFGGFALAASRPYEGLVLFAMVALAISVACSRAALAAVVVAAIVGTCGLMLLLAYNRSITGSITQMPYSIYEGQYDPVPNFLWQQMRPIPNYRSEELANFYNFCAAYFRRLHAPGGFSAEWAKKFDVMRRALTGEPAGFDLVLYLPLLALPWAWRDRTISAAIVALIIFAGSTLLIVWWMQLHYLAPAAGLATLVVIALLRAGVSLPRGPALVSAVIVVFAGVAAANGIRYARSAESGPEVNRARIAAALTKKGGEHVILVPQSVFNYVHNGCDIDRQPVVWARSLGPEEDARLMNHFPTRSVWKLDAAAGDRLISVRRPR